MSTTTQSYRSRGLVGGAAATQIGGYTLQRPTAKITGWLICNTSGVTINATAYILDANGATNNIIFNVPITAGQTLVLAGQSDEYIVLITGDKPFVSIAGGGGTADVSLGVEETN